MPLQRITPQRSQASTAASRAKSVPRRNDPDNTEDLRKAYDMIAECDKRQVQHSPSFARHSSRAPFGAATIL